MKKCELVSIAKSKQIPLKHNISKAELIELLGLEGVVDEMRDSYHRTLVLTNTLTGEKTVFRGYKKAQEALHSTYKGLRYKIDQKTKFRLTRGGPKIYELAVYGGELQDSQTT